MELKKLLGLGMILALVFGVANAEAAKKRRAPRCHGQVINCANNGDTRKCMACVAHKEAISEGMGGMLRVLGVVLTRAKSGKFPHSVCGVVYQRAQFSPMSQPYTCVTSQSWAMANEAARRAKPTGKLYFYADYIRRPRWARYCAGTEQPRGDTHIYMTDCFANARQLAHFKRETRTQYASAMDSAGASR